MGMVGLHAGLELLLEVGVENIAAELLRKRAWLVPALQQKGWTVLQADAPPLNASSIISFYRAGAEPADLAALFQKLREAGIEMSLRRDRSGRQYLRDFRSFLQHGRGIAASARIPLANAGRIGRGAVAREKVCENS